MSESPVAIRGSMTASTQLRARMSPLATGRERARKLMLQSVGAQRGRVSAG